MRKLRIDQRLRIVFGGEPEERSPRRPIACRRMLACCIIGRARTAQVTRNVTGDMISVQWRAQLEVYGGMIAKARTWLRACLWWWSSGCVDLESGSLPEKVAGCCRYLEEKSPRSACSLPSELFASTFSVVRPSREIAREKTGRGCLVLLCGDFMLLPNLVRRKLSMIAVDRDHFYDIYITICQQCGQPLTSWLRIWLAASRIWLWGVDAVHHHGDGLSFPSPAPRSTSTSRLMIVFYDS